MEALGILRFWRKTFPGDDVSADGYDVRNTVFGSEDGESEDNDSFFDLDIKSPAIKGGDQASEKDSQFIESPRDVFLSKIDFSNSKPSSPIFKVFRLKSFKKSTKCVKPESNAELKASPVTQPSKLGHSGRFEVKCRPEEVSAAPVLARDNSLRSKLMKDSFDYETCSNVVSKSIPKYLKLMKPFYSKTSRMAKVTDSSPASLSSSPVSAPVNLSPRKLSEGSRIGSFKIVARNLGKSRSASAAVGVAPPSLRRRDDTLLDDGIQSAILHCKKSYNASPQEILNTRQEKTRFEGRNTCEEQKICSI